MAFEGRARVGSTIKGMDIRIKQIIRVMRPIK